MCDENEDLGSIGELREWRNEILQSIIESRSEALDWPCVEPGSVRGDMERARQIREAVTERLSLYGKKWTGKKLSVRSRVSPVFLGDIWNLRKSWR